MVVLTWSYSPSLAWMAVNFMLLPRISPQAPHFLSSSVNFFFQWSPIAHFTSNVNVNNDPRTSKSTRGGEKVQWWKNINCVSFMTSLSLTLTIEMQKVWLSPTGHSWRQNISLCNDSHDWHLLLGQRGIQSCICFSMSFQHFLFSSEIQKIQTRKCHCFPSKSFLEMALKYFHQKVWMF